jgi:BolA family transcriptional regulator, general stress-responsive regulator
MNESRVELIRNAIERRLAPEQLEVEDESALHAGHPGAQGGAGHFRVHVVSAQFRGRSMIQRHRLVYEAVGDLMGRDIHALAIDARTPDEIAS